MTLKIALAALLALGAATTADAKTKHYRMTLDGYCDGWDFTADKDTGLAVGTHLYDNCGGNNANAAIMGVAGKGLGNKGWILGDESFFVNYGFTGSSLIFSDHTWIIVGTFDGGATGQVISSGTWTDGYAPARSGKRPAGAPK
ncbi:MAG: hypothetical protein JO056_01410 [Alphaproteobacteria bacterium]|nr:hypothetical protein [Alphaproteobacteria bacterium]